MTDTLNGIVPVLPTPFFPDEAIDFPSLGQAIEFAITSNAAALCVPAYGSEFYKLSDAERISIVEYTINCTQKRIPVIAQANHPSACVAAELAGQLQALGADIISIALPRQFPVADIDLMRYCGHIADAISVPLLIQDFNPNGPTVGAPFLCELNRQHANVRFAKLEEPLVLAKLKQIQDQAGNAIGLLTGWGGQYLLDSVGAGAIGIMPGTAICDLFARVWTTRHTPAGHRLFAQLLPYITFSLQSFELFLWMEKRILQRRGILQHALTRTITRTFDPFTLQRAEQIMDDVIDAATQPADVR